MRPGIVKENVIKKFRQLRNPGLYKLFLIPGHLSEKEAIALYRNSKISNVKVGLEIGSYLGKSTNFLAKGISTKHGVLHCIDTFRNHDMSEGPRNTHKEFLQNTKKFKGILNLHIGFSNDLEIINVIPDNLDLIFVDGSHDSESVSQDIQNFLPKLKRGSHIIFHDYGNTYGVKNPVDSQLAIGELLIVEIIDSMIVCQKK